MSCNGCRVLRKGCSDTCILRSCLQWIESPEAQGHATVFVAKFFGRAGMMSFIGAVPESQRPALFQSLLYEACGRTINPVFGAVGLLWSGNWGLCQAAVETVLKGGYLKALSTSSSMSTSSKPIQPLIGNRSEPPMTMMTMTSTKRSHCMTEFNNKFDIESVKRLRSSDQHKELMHTREEPASADQEQQIVCMMNKPVVYVATTEEKGLAPAGQLVAPVARRVRPQTGYGPASMLMREHQQQAQQQGPSQAYEEQERRSVDAVELDLTLSARPKRGGEVESPLTMRTSSPSSFSMNSEGSVISSDTAEFSVCGLRTLSPALQEGRQFIRLL